MSDELAHYGIKGMKWGVRNKSDDSSSGGSSSSGDSPSNGSSSGSGINKKQVAKALAITGGAAAILVGSYYVHNKIDTKARIADIDFKQGKIRDAANMYEGSYKLFSEQYDLVKRNAQSAKDKEQAFNNYVNNVVDAKGRYNKRVDDILDSPRSTRKERKRMEDARRIASLR